MTSLIVIAFEGIYIFDMQWFLRNGTALVMRI